MSTCDLCGTNEKQVRRRKPVIDSLCRQCHSNFPLSKLNVYPILQEGYLLSVLPKEVIEPHRVVPFDSKSYTELSLALQIESPQVNRAQENLVMESPEIEIDSIATPLQVSGSRSLQRKPLEEEANKLLSEIGNYLQRVIDDNLKMEQDIGRLKATIEELNTILNSKEENIQHLKAELQKMKTSIENRKEHHKKNFSKK